MGMKGYWGLEIRVFWESTNGKQSINRNAMVMNEDFSLYIYFFCIFIVLLDCLQYIQQEIHEFPHVQHMDRLIET